MTKKTTGELIKDELVRQNISQKELCIKTGISESAMSKYLSSNSSLRIDILSKIVKALDVNIYQFLDIKEKEEDTYDICKTALLARKGTKLTEKEKQELINLIFGHE